MKANDLYPRLLATMLTAFVEAAFYELRPSVPFQHGLYIRAMCHLLERVERGEVRQALILVPPRHLKSHCASVCLPVWALGRNPSRKITTVSYGASLSEEFSMASRYLMESDIVRAAFPGLHIDPHKASVKRLQTTEGGVRFTTSVGGPLTGTGGDLLIFDDLSKAEDVASATQRDKLWDWFTGTALTRRDPPKTGAFVLVAQRLHEDDIPGRLIATGQCKVLTLPAIETRDREIALPDRRTWRRRKGDVLLPEHMDLDDFERMRAEIGHPRFEAQYQQSPVPAGGNIVRSEWFRTYQDAQKRDDYEAIVQNWDVAAVPGESYDYSVCTTWGLIGSHIDLLYVYRTQQDPPQLLDTARRLRAKWRPELLVVETQGVGRSHYSHLLQDDRRGVRSMTPKANKVERMSKETYTLERGEVRLPADAPWKEVFLGEVAAFPNGKYDDQVDSMSQALHAIRIRPAELRHCSRYKGR